MDYKIKIITPPDVIFDQSTSIVLICPSTDTKKYLENFIAKIDDHLNVYVYNNDNNIQWLLAQCRMSNYIIVDIDNCDNKTNQFLSYILSLPNTYYRTEHMKAPWDLLNKNRFYDFPNLIEDNNEGTE